MDIIWDGLIEACLKFVEGCLGAFVSAFNASLQVMVTEIGKTPIQFSATLVNTLRGLSDNVILPVAGLILTYILCKDLIDYVLERNAMQETSSFDLFKIIFRIFLAILLVTNVFNITLAFFDLGQYLVQGVTTGNVNIAIDLQTLMDALNPPGNPLQGAGGVGTALLYLLFSFVIMVIGFVGVGMIYLIAWTRIVTIFIYISVAPIPFATLMNKDWVGGIGQNYIKNLCALAIQGFLMMVCLVIYSIIVSEIGNQLATQNGFMVMVMLVVMMFVCIKSLMSCLNLAKSIMQAQ